jgi:hypothetical protein
MVLFKLVALLMLPMSSMLFKCTSALCDNSNCAYGCDTTTGSTCCFANCLNGCERYGQWPSWSIGCSPPSVELLDNVTGLLPSVQCKSGFAGNYCVLSCGVHCNAKQCNNLGDCYGAEKTVDFTRPAAHCDPLFYGARCQLECKVQNCSITSACTANGRCIGYEDSRFKYDVPAAHCKDSFHLGDRCEEACNSDRPFFGRHCRWGCTNGGDCIAVPKVWSALASHCLPGWGNGRCTFRCIDSSTGAQCSLCTVEGECYQGLAVEPLPAVSCEHGAFGADCGQTCNTQHCRIKECTVQGHCVGYKTDQGCIHCEEGYHGENCELPHAGGDDAVFCKLPAVGRVEPRPIDSSLIASIGISAMCGVCQFAFGDVRESVLGSFGESAARTLQDTSGPAHLFGSVAKSAFTHVVPVIDVITAGSGCAQFGALSKVACNVFGGILFVANPVASLGVLASCAVLSHGASKLCELIPSNLKAPTFGVGDTGATACRSICNNNGRKRNSNASAQQFLTLGEQLLWPESFVGLATVNRGASHLDQVLLVAQSNHSTTTLTFSRNGTLLYTNWAICNGNATMETASVLPADGLMNATNPPPPTCVSESRPWCSRNLPVAMLLDVIAAAKLSNAVVDNRTTVTAVDFAEEYIAPSSNASGSATMTIGNVTFQNVRGWRAVVNVFNQSRIDVRVLGTPTRPLLITVETNFAPSTVLTFWAVAPLPEEAGPTPCSANETLVQSLIRALANGNDSSGIIKELLPSYYPAMSNESTASLLRTTVSTTEKNLSQTTRSQSDVSISATTTAITTTATTATTTTDLASPDTTMVVSGALPLLSARSESVVLGICICMMLV